MTTLAQAEQALKAALEDHLWANNILQNLSCAYSMQDAIRETISREDIQARTQADADCLAIENTFINHYYFWVKYYDALTAAKETFAACVLANIHMELDALGVEADKEFKETLWRKWQKQSREIPLMDLFVKSQDICAEEVRTAKFKEGFPEGIKYSYY